MRILLLILSLWCFSLNAQPYVFTFTQVDTSGTDTRVRSFGGFNDYFEHDQAVNYPNPAITTQHSYDYYFRITADEISKTWSNFDAHMNRAIDRGEKVIFRVYCIDDGYSGNVVAGNKMAYPTAWHTSMQGEANPDFKIDVVWWPNYNSASFQANCAAMEVFVDNHLRTTFHTAAGVSWRYKDVIAARDVDFMGMYGEGHTYSGAAADTWPWPTGTQWTLAAWQNIINSEKAVVRNVPMLGNVNFFAANSRVPSGVGSWFLQDANAWGLYGLRLDNFGHKAIFDNEFTNNATTENGINFKTYMSNRYVSAPWVAEPIQFGYGAAGQVNYYDIKRQNDLLHITLCENADNIMAGQNPVQTDVQNLFRSVIKRMAYRLSFVSGQMSDSLRASGNINIQLTAINTGLAPAYEDFQMIYYFKQSGVIKFQFTSTFHPKLFLPGTQAIIDNQIAPAGISGGYDMYIKLLQVPDSSGKRFRKPMPLQINTVNGVSSQQSDTSYFLRTINVASTGTPPPPPPPPPPNQPPVILMGGDQTDTLPKSTDTLTVQVSDPNGDAVTLAWTQVSGPNTATLAGATTTNLIISGLIQGTYQFRLTASDGKGGITSGFTNVFVFSSVVTPPPPPPPTYSPPTITAGADTIIQLLADSAILRGHVTHKDTLIQSALWSKFSGTGGTIVTPNDSTTRVTGLTAGFYQYRFRITDKAGNIVDDYMTVQVLPVVPVPPPPLPAIPQPTKVFGIKSN